MPQLSLICSVCNHEIAVNYLNHLLNFLWLSSAGDYKIDIVVSSIQGKALCRVCLVKALRNMADAYEEWLGQAAG